MTTPFEAYKEYLSVKNHFTIAKVDYFRYIANTNFSQISFEKRKDKAFFFKLAKRPDLINFLVANFVENPKSFVKELAYSSSTEKIYNNWNKRQQSISYIIKEDLEKLDEDFDTNFICKENEHPILLKRYLGKKITLETFCLLLSITGADQYWDKKMQNDIIWNEVKTLYNKYLPFIKADKDKIKKLIMDHFTR